MAIAAPKVENPDDHHTSGIVFAVVVLAYQVMICLFYGFWASYQPVTTFRIFDQGQIQLVACMTILVLVGFGLCNAYITNASFSGLGFTLLIFGLCIQHYFMIKDFWQKAGVSDPNDNKFFQNNPYLPKISFVNYGQDRYNYSSGTGYDKAPQFFSHYSFVDAIACALACVIALGSLIGRMKLLGAFALSLIGTFIYEVNSQLLWRYSVYDVGYGMRVFLFGGMMGFVASLIQGRKDTTFNSPRYISVYASRAFGLLGICFIYCLFPVLVASGLYKTSDNNHVILYSSVLRMYLALTASLLGSFVACSFTYRKFYAHDIIFGGITGAIAMSSSCNLHQNPAVALSVGFITGLSMTIYLSSQLRKLNKNGVVVSLVTLERFVYPGFISSIISAALVGINQGNDGDYIMFLPSNRTNIQAGGYQIVGGLLSIAFGIGAGLVLGLLFKLLNKKTASDTFRDAQLFRPDFPPSIHYVEWKET